MSGDVGVKKKKLLSSGTKAEQYSPTQHPKLENTSQWLLPVFVFAYFCCYCREYSLMIWSLVLWVLETGVLASVDHQATSFFTEVPREPDIAYRRCHPVPTAKNPMFMHLLAISFSPGCDVISG